MAFTDNPMFLRTLAPQTVPDLHAEPRERLRTALLKLRERAEVLAGEIHRDLPDFTVHDITHLDALWEMADLIAGPGYPLNPLEAFALGAVFLIHDLGLGLAAYPGGLAELKKGPGWQDALSIFLRKHLGRIPTAKELASPPPEVERMAVQERLRVLHAEQAERLALASWYYRGGPEYHLIDDPDLRQAIGPLLGKIAHSHWWPVSRLSSEFETSRGALPKCPTEWTLDSLKVAALLRTADAAHVDGRRAPGFLRAVRRPNGASQEHWIFQDHLLKPRVDDDRLVYTTARPFPTEEVDAWWLCEETLRMLDRELRNVDALLADRGRPQRLRVHSVAGVESPDRLRKYVEVSGWTPVDARLHVSNVADLVRRMGGEQLYGDKPYVPLRELIQNASDAVRARRLLEERDEAWGRVTVRLGRDDLGPWIEVEDTGVGMSEEVLKGPLLDFGTTYWGSTLMREEHEGLWAKGFEPTGRFGIGFFSVFMWGHRVRVSSRRYTAARHDSRILEFRTGLEALPLVRLAKPEEQLSEGGSRVRVWLNKEPYGRGGFIGAFSTDVLYASQEGLGALCAWLAPALDVDLYVEDKLGSRCVVAASDWCTIDPPSLVARISAKSLSLEEKGHAIPMQVLHDTEGNILGRAVIAPTLPDGVITVGGLRATVAKDLGGIMIGSAQKVARDGASLLASKVLLANWASGQSGVIAKELLDPIYQMRCSERVSQFGGDPGQLVIVKWKAEFLTYEAFVQLKEVPDHLFVVDEQSYGLYRGMYKDLVLHSGFLLTFSGALTLKALAALWGCSPADVSCSRQFGYIADVEIGVAREGSPYTVANGAVTSMKRPGRKAKAKQPL